ncbi:hypothetical protein X943_000669 [Babesia divergens]|uniref:Uncharacterized protein n=1 Tax=Babesia divergens TaxID=32595 RepID=A0AAD9LKX3_BABDI|nr:hypothetical protein X943_000669 [Babesia divergens]
MSRSLFFRISQRFSNLAEEVLEYYAYATLKQQHIMMLCSGAVLGAIIGRKLHKDRVAAGEFSDNLELVAYNTDSVESFETNWNRLARFAQKRPDYKHTMLYKAVHWEQPFPHYLQLRLWKHDDSIDKYTDLATRAGLMQKVDGAATITQRARPTTVIDDSIRREIPF